MQNIINTFFTTMIAAALLLFSISLFMPEKAVAAHCASQPPACEVCEGSGGTWANGACTGNAQTPALTGANSVFENVINILTFIVGAVSVIMLIIGGLRYVLSNGDSNAVSSAKNTILYAIIGIVVAFAARAIVFFVIDEIG